MGHPQPKFEDSWAWKGGASPTTYQKLAFEKYGKLRVCELCGSANRISVHHKDRNRQNYSEENLQILCDACHKRIHIRDGDMLKVKGCKKPIYSIETIMDLHDLGHSSNKIAAILGCTPQAVRYRLKQQGVQMPNHTRNDIDNGMLKSLYLSGMSPRCIAEMFGTSHTLVMRRLKSVGVKMRSKKESWANQHSSSHTATIEAIQS